MTETTKVNLLGLTRSEMGAFFTEMGEKAFRASQVMKWIYHHGVTDFDAMTDLGKALRAKLQERAEIRLPEVVVDAPSRDGTRKWMLRLGCDQSVECVFIPEDDRGTLCISSQVGCTLNCTFCSTARQGFSRNLTVAEIIGQILFAAITLGIPQNKGERVITNIVLMGMGEPLMNFDNVVKAVEIMQDDVAFGVSKRRVTLSTSGVVPAMYELRKHTDISLAVSLHAPNDELRNELVPINRKYPIAELLEACRAYVADLAHRSVTIEYVMIDGVNDSADHARQLVKLLRNVPCKVNLIPFNPFPGSDYKRSPREVVARFQDILMAAGITCITRRTRGEDIAAACGQLVGEVQDRTRRSERLASIPVRSAAP